MHATFVASGKQSSESQTDAWLWIDEICRVAGLVWIRMTNETIREMRQTAPTEMEMR